MTRRFLRALACASWLLASSLTASCNRGTEAVKTQGSEAATPERTAACPARREAGESLPNTSSELETLAYWLARSSAAELDEVLLDVDELAVQDAALRNAPDGSPRIVDLARAPSSDELRAALRERLAGYHKQLASGQYVSPRKDAARALELDLASFVERRELRVALAPIDLHCVPFAEAIHSTRGSAGFDRNRCSQARAQEPIELLGQLSGLWLARTSNAFGFVDSLSSLSPVVPAELAPRFRANAALTLSRELELVGKVLPAGTLLRADGEQVAWLATEREFVRSRRLRSEEASPTKRPLTFRSFLTEAFRYVRSPYGWGDLGGGRDCSRLVLDVLASFGLGLPRTSTHQSQAGRYVVDVPAETSETERLALLDEARKRGVVLVQFPGHIMFYLGRDQAGVPRVLHSFAEYLAPCPGGGETLFEVGRVAVTDLTLGHGTSRKSFLERITHLTVFGKDPGYELLALSRFRAPLAPPEPLDKSCKKGRETSLSYSPREPDESRPLRVVAVSERDVRPARVWLVAPDGALIAPEMHDLGVGPYARWVEQTAPKPGKWRALVADGPRVLSCEEFRVASSRKSKSRREPARAAEAPAWQASGQWDRASEGLYAAFVEQLFSHPVEDLRSWSSLSELLQKPERNLLFDHRGLNEDTALTLAPDCADLPYLLRGYFAWKVGLPFAFRRCTRGRAGVPPRCDESIVSNEKAVRANSELAAFEAFWKELTNGVHSASGRTLPDDPHSDLYPIALDRRALPPGTVFTDPYGHMIVLAKWLPQGLAGEGMLMGADAQPDATVGRRRFWRGNFLFNPDTSDVGAGFKAFRPIVAQRKSAELVALDNAEIAANGDFLSFSREQYTGKLDDFYARMDELVYPRPVAVLDRMRRVVDALREQVERRVEAIDVGEAGLRGLELPIAMPEGYAIFETSGPWEDFATPSRDMRLLIAIDAVRAFPAQVREHPERFGVRAGDQALGEVDRLLEQQLKSQRFSYTRSDGSKFELTLADVVSRVDTLETGYNPNDCIEARWGAPVGSSERAPCKRAAPDDQRATMERYRSWFHERARPPRPAKR